MKTAITELARTPHLPTVTILIALVAVSSAKAVESDNSLRLTQKQEVRMVWKDCVRLHSNTKAEKLVFADMTEEGDKEKKWKLISGTTNRDGSNDVAELFFDSMGNLLYSHIDGGSESGDHSYNVEYCFRKNGGLAFIVRTLITTQGLPDGVREERRIWIDEHQKKIDDEIKVFDLTSGNLEKKKDQNYFQTDKMGWRTLPETPEKLTAKEFLSEFPKLKP